MGLQFSTTNYEKIIDLLDPPYLEHFNFLNNSLVDAMNIDNDNRFLVYRHREKNIFLFYTGNLCAVTNCFEVSEQLLLTNGKQFDDFYKMKEYVIKYYPKKEIISELVKYETSHDVSILNYLELGVTTKSNRIDIDIEFTDSEDTDSEVDSEGGSYEFVMKKDIYKDKEIDNSTRPGTVVTEKTFNYLESEFGDFDNIFKDEFIEIDNNCGESVDDAHNNITNSLNNFESFFDNKFSYDINTDWSLDWNHHPLPINKMPTINETNKEIKIETTEEPTLEDKTSKEESNKEEVVIAKSIENKSTDQSLGEDNTVIADGESIEGDESTDGDNTTVDESTTTTDESTEEEAVEEIIPKQYSSIFEKILPDFNYFNFLK